MLKVQRIAVIGAGAAGLCAARLLSSEKHFEPIVYEATDHVGGTWFYTDSTDKDENGYPVHSSMYKDLRTNLPKQVMAFPDMPFDEYLPSFILHNEVLGYLKKYCDTFGLQEYIKLNTLVDEVKLVPQTCSTSLPKWEVKTFDWKTQLQQTQIFDGVMICNGHYSVPNIPVVDGSEKFKGNIMHSHHYRKKESFENQRVVLFGAKASGTDIALNLSKVAKKVFLSHNGPRILSPLPSNVQQELALSRFTETGVIFEDGKSAECDTVMFCTGYNYTFPFFKDSSVIQVAKNRITPLYKHLIHIHHQNLSLIGICQQICPFPQFYCQIMYAMGVMDGTVKLPPVKEMLQDEEEDYQERVRKGLPKRGAHVLAGDQWAYNDQLADLCGKSTISQSVRLLYDLCHTRRTFNLQHYKEDEFSMSDKGNYCRVDAAEN